MVSIKNLLFIASIATAAVLPRQDTDVVLADLKELDTDVNKLNKAVSFGPINSIAVTVNIDHVLADLNQAAGDASGPIPEPFAKEIVEYLSKTLQPDAIKAISSIDNRRSAFEAVLLGPAVISDLKKLRGRSAALGEALETGIPTNAAKISTLFASVDVAFDKAIKDFEL